MAGFEAPDDKITLSPLIFDFEGGLGRVLGACQSMRLWLEAKYDECKCDFPIKYFASLSGSDLAFVALPQTPSELNAVDRLVRHARILKLASLEKHLSNAQPDIDRAERWPGHACVSVEPMLAFREEAVEWFGDAGFMEEEEKVGLQLRFRLRVDSGHEDQVVEDLADVHERQEKDANASVGTLVRSAWGHTSLEGSFDHLRDFVNVWKDLWFAEDLRRDWREQHLVGSVSNLSFLQRHPDDPPDKPHPYRVWTLTEAVKKILDEIEERLEGFGEQFLSKRQAAELMSLFLTYYRCFFHHELVGVARDLLPFFQRLAEVFGMTDHWSEYLGRPSKDSARSLTAADDYQQFLGKEMERLLFHVGRAVRNRVEHRSLQSDPPVPHTLSHGACKLINAYSATFWLASELFRRSAAGGVGAPGNARQFAGCVCAGSEGYVLCTDLFAKFRRFVDTSRRSAEDPGLITAGASATPLLLLDISGNSLLRPEVCFVQCLHEMAELSDWIVTDRCTSLRRILKRWVIREVLLAFQVCLEETVSHPLSPDEQKEIDEFAEHYFAYCFAAQYSQESIKSLGDIESVMHKCYGDALNAGLKVQR